MKKFDILSLGSIYLDINSTNFPFTNGLNVETETVGKNYKVSPGGSAVIFSLVSSNLGLKPVFIGKVGDDIFGKIVSEQLKSSGIEPALIKSDTNETNLGMNFINPQGKTLMTVVGSANQSLEAQEVIEEIDKYLDDISFLYLGGYFKLELLQNYYPNIIAKAKQKGVKVILDHGRVTNKVTQDQIDSIKKILPQVDIYLPSKDEFLKVFSCSTIEDGLDEVIKINPNITTVVKNAKEDAVGIDKNNKIVYSKSLPVKPINTVGAGDTFNSGFIKAQLDGLLFKKSIDFAHKVAAYKISKNNYPKLPDLLE